MISEIREAIQRWEKAKLPYGRHDLDAAGDALAALLRREPAGEPSDEPPCATFSPDENNAGVCKHCGWIEESHIERERNALGEKKEGER